MEVNDKNYMNSHTYSQEIIWRKTCKTMYSEAPTFEVKTISIAVNRNRKITEAISRKSQQDLQEDHKLDW